MGSKLKRIYELLEQYKFLLRKWEILEKNIFEFWRINLTYNSTAIEWNTLTEMETKLVVEDWISIWNKKVVEILEVKNHAKALDYVIDLSKKIKINQIDENIILEIHKIILQWINDEEAWKYRNCRVRISWSSVVFPNYIKIPQLMNDFVNWIKTTNDDVVNVVIKLHLKFVSIHPFVDGNWRVARLLFNLALLTEWFPLISIRVKNREKYLKSIEKAQLTWNEKEYIDFMLWEIIKNLEEYLK